MAKKDDNIGHNSQVDAKALQQFVEEIAKQQVECENLKMESDRELATKTAPFKEKIKEIKTEASNHGIKREVLNGYIKKAKKQRDIDRIPDNMSPPGREDYLQADLFG